MRLQQNHWCLFYVKIKHLINNLVHPQICSLLFKKHPFSTFDFTIAFGFIIKCTNHLHSIHQPSCIVPNSCDFEQSNQSWDSYKLTKYEFSLLVWWSLFTTPHVMPAIWARRILVQPCGAAIVMKQVLARQNERSIVYFQSHQTYGALLSIACLRPAIECIFGQPPLCTLHRLMESIISLLEPFVTFTHSE